MARAGHVLLAVHVAVDLAFEKLDGGVSVGISPNREPLAGEGPVQGVVFAFALAREILFVRTRDATKSAYHQIRLVEGLELEEILCFHVRNVLVDILRGGGLRREKSHSTTRTHLSLHETRKTLDTSKSSLHSGRYTSSFARFLSGYVESNCWDDGGGHLGLSSGYNETACRNVQLHSLCSVGHVLEDLNGLQMISLAFPHFLLEISDAVHVSDVGAHLLP